MLQKNNLQGHNQAFLELLYSSWVKAHYNWRLDCFKFNSEATIPNLAGPHMADRATNPSYEGLLQYMSGTTPRNEGWLQCKPGLPGPINSPEPTDGVPSRMGQGSRWHHCSQWKTPNVQWQDHFASKRRAITYSPPCSQGWTNRPWAKGWVTPDRKPRGLKSEVLGQSAYSHKARYHAVITTWLHDPHPQL